VNLPFAVRLRPPAAAFLAGRSGASPSRSSAAATDRLRALFVLEHVEGGEPAADRLAPGDAFTAVMRHAHCFDPESADSSRRLVTHYLELASAVPVYRLRFTPGLDRLDAVLDCIEHTV
jgi:hypothetical protein